MRPCHVPCVVEFRLGIAICQACLEEGTRRRWVPICGANSCHPDGLRLRLVFCRLPETFQRHLVLGPQTKMVRHPSLYRIAAVGCWRGSRAPFVPRLGFALLTRLCLVFHLGCTFSLVFPPLGLYCSIVPFLAELFRGPILLL